jgi:hypothetical protein
MDGTRGMHGEEQKSRRDLLDNSEGKRPLGRKISRWEDNVNMVLKGIGWDRGYWIRHRFCKRGDNNSGFINCGIFEFSSAPWSCL